MAYQFDYAAYDKVTTIGGKQVTTRCGRIVNKKELGIDQLAEKLISDGYVKSLKKDELMAVLNAYYRGAKEYVYEGYIVRTGFASLQAKINGALGENDTIGTNTRLRIELAPRDDLKLDKAECSFHNVAEQASVSILSVATVGGNIGEWQKNKQANAVGSNLYFDEKIGDIVTWTSGELSGEVAVDATSENVLTMAWDSEWDEFTAGTEITLKFSLHGGNADANPKVITKTVKVVVG